MRWMTVTSTQSMLQRGEEAEIQGLAYSYICNVRAGACKQVQVADRIAGNSSSILMHDTIRSSHPFLTYLSLRQRFLCYR